jgi:hypothetical protein
MSAQKSNDVILIHFHISLTWFRKKERQGFELRLQF